MATLTLIIAAYLILSGVMAAVDAALLSITGPEVHELVLHRKRGSKALKTVKEELTRAMIVVVIVTNTVNVLGPIVVGQQTVATFGIAALGVVTAILTLGTIVVSEIVPKAVGTRYAPEIGRIAAVPILALQLILYPIVMSLEWLSRLFARGRRRIGTEEQIRSLTTIGRQAGHIEADEGSLIHRAFTLNDRTAADIMTPLAKVVSISARSTIGQAAELVRKSLYSRYPVFGDSPDDVVGIVMIREILEAAADGRTAESIRSITRPELTVQAATRSDVLLVHFRNRHIHLAVVKREGHTIGVVSLEDVLEELVGEIEDETDV